MFLRSLNLAAPFWIAIVILLSMRTWFDDILLYESIIVSSLLGMTIYSIVYFSFFKFISHQYNFTYELFLSTIVSFLLFYSLSTATILNIDRSKSFHVIAFIYDKQPVSQLEFRIKLIKKFSESEWNSYNSRINEQIKRGIIVKKDGFISLGSKGNFIYHFSNSLAEIFSLEGWFESKQQFTTTLEVD